MEWLFIRFAIWGSYPFLFLFDDTSISWSVFSTGSFWSNDHFSNGFTHFRAYFSCCTLDRKSTRLNSSHVSISYAVFCLKKKNYKSRNKISADQVSSSYGATFTT